MKKNITLFFILFSIYAFSQGEKISDMYNKEEITVNSLLKGSLYTPIKSGKNTDLVILIAGSGPTNRDGNQIGMINNSLKFTAQELAKNGIAVFSYDKRIIAQMITGKVDERTLTFDDFINDAKDVVTFFRSKNQYHKIIIAGHSEGSLIGMIASDKNTDAFISLAGAGRTIDLIIEDQIANQAPGFKQETHDNLAMLKKGETFELKNQMLASIFRESVQPYMISWIKYNPQEEIKKLHIPVLIVNGTKDIQVGVQEAELLKQAKPDAKLVIVENMNHIFKEIKGDKTENIASYTNPDLPVSKVLIDTMVQFIKSL